MAETLRPLGVALKWDVQQDAETGITSRRLQVVAPASAPLSAAGISPHGLAAYRPS